MDLSSFISDWGTPVEVERKNRIKLSLAAYAYEFHSDSIIDDAAFDKLSDQINVQVRTGNDVMDDFFQEHFVTHTGMWIQKHPDIQGLEKIYIKHHKRKRK